jgi:hypothetical protein
MSSAQSKQFNKQIYPLLFAKRRAAYLIGYAASFVLLEIKAGFELDETR